MFAPRPQRTHKERLSYLAGVKDGALQDVLQSHVSLRVLLLDGLHDLQKTGIQINAARAFEPQQSALPCSGARTKRALMHTHRSLAQDGTR
jgi:hypothetical protein